MEKSTNYHHAPQYSNLEGCTNVIHGPDSSYQVSVSKGLGGYGKVSKYALTLGYMYPFSKRTNLYFMNTYTDGSRGLNETVDVTSNCFVTNLGIQHRF